MGSEIFYPAVGGDDGYRGSVAGYNNSASTLFLGDWGEGLNIWIRFPNITIPQGAAITGAYVKITAYGSNSNATCNANCYFNNVDNAVAPTDASGFDALSLTGAVAWNAIPAWVNGTQYDSPNLISILQNIVDRAGWSSGNAAQIVIKNNSSSGNAYRQVSSFDHSGAAEKAELHVTWTGDTNINLTEPFLAETLIQSDIKIIVPSAVLIAESSMSEVDIYQGHVIDCPSPLISISSLQSDMGISIPSVSLSAQGEIQSDIHVGIPSAIFTAQGELDASNVSLGHAINLTEALLVQGGLQAIPQVGIPSAQFTVNSGLIITPEIQLSLDPLVSTVSLSADIEQPFTIEGYPRVYTFTLTGGADGVSDVVIPIKSFQSTIKNGDPTYLSVVIPGTDYASAINLRTNGYLVVRMGYLTGGEIILSEIISMVYLESISIHDGTTNKSITLDGHMTESFTRKEVNLTGASYKNLSAGKLRYRCTPDLYVRPGDLVNINDDSFTVEKITHSVSPELENFEVSE